MTTRSRAMDAAIIDAFSRGAPVTEAQRERVLEARRTSGRFARLRTAADVLAATHSGGRLRHALSTELFRAQFEFNHALVDALEDLPWLDKRSGRDGEVRTRLEPWVHWRLLVPRRDGLRGHARWGVKTVATSAAATLLSAQLAALAEANRRLMRAVTAAPDERSSLLREAQRHLSTSSPMRGLFAAQRAFIEELQRFFQTPAPPAPPPSPSRVVEHPDWYVRVPAGETWLGVPASALQGEVDIVFGDSRYGAHTVLRPRWSREHLWSESFIGAFMMRKKFADAHGLTANQPALAWLLHPSVNGERARHAGCIVSTAPAPTPADPGDADVVRADVQRLERVAEIETAGSVRKVRVQPKAGTRVSIIVPFKDKVPLLKGLLRSIDTHQPGVEYELILVSNNSSEQTLRYLRDLRDARVRWFEWNHPFNYSQLNNVAARRATGDLLLFLNNDIEARHAGWLADLAGHAQLPEVAAVGARLLYPDGSIQHAGVVLGMRGLAGHMFVRWRPEDGSTPIGSPEATRPWSAVTGACLMIRRARFEEIGGFNEAMRVSGSDIELCLRATRPGERVLCVSHVHLTHLESQSRGRDAAPRLDVKNEARAYANALLDGDPWHHPALSLEVANGYELAAQTPIDHALTVLSALDPALTST